jgi:hypothetical protein
MTTEGSSTTDSATNLGPRQHALLFAWIATETLARAGQEAGERALLRAVEQYGRERGERMAQRARRDGQPLTMASYLAYGEWRDPWQEARSSSRYDGSDLHTCVTRCAWHQAWIEEGALPVGRLYCQAIDAVLVTGFSPALRLEVLSTLSSGAEACHFVFHEAASAGDSPPAVNPRNGMPWDYHLAHLWHTLGAVIVEALGAPGEEAMAAALATMSNRLGEAVAQRVLTPAQAGFTRAD